MDSNARTARLASDGASVQWWRPVDRTLPQQADQRCPDLYEVFRS